MEYNITFEGTPLKIIDSNVTQGKQTQAGTEGKEYEFGKIPDSEYVTCIYQNTVWVVLKTPKTAQCTCQYFKENKGMICEHLLALRNIKEEDFEAAPNDIITLLTETEGWNINDAGMLVPPSEPFTPEVVAELPPIDKEPEGNALNSGVEVDQNAYEAAAKREKKTCPYCELSMSADRYERHLQVCKKRPKGAEPVKEAPKKTEKEQKSPPQVTQDAPPAKEKQPSMKQKTKQKPAAEKKKPQPTPTAVSTDVRKMPSDAEFRDAKTKRILQAQGGFYKVAGGKDVPNAMSVQAYAAGKGRISTEVIQVEQDADHVLAIVRCHRDGIYTDASVYINFDVQRKRELLKVANKNPKAVLGWNENGPIFDDGFEVETGTKHVPLVVYLFNRMTDFAYFAPRTAESQAARRAQAKMLGSEWRDAEEINMEDEEVDTVNKR